MCALHALHPVAGVECACTLFELCRNRMCFQNSTGRIWVLKGTYARLSLSALVIQLTVMVTVRYTMSLFTL